MVLLCPQAHNNLLPGSVSSQVDYYTSKVTAAIPMTLTAVGIQGADLCEPLALFGIAIQKVPGKHSRQRPSAGSHSFQTSRSPILITWKSVEGGAWILARVVVTTRYVCPSQLVTYVQAYRVILDRTSTDSHSSHTVINVQVSCLSLWLHKLGNRYSCSHARISKHPPADLAIHYNTLHAAKEQPDVTSYIPCILSLACNWSIVS